MSARARSVHLKRYLDHNSVRLSVWGDLPITPEQYLAWSSLGIGRTYSERSRLALRRALEAWVIAGQAHTVAGADGCAVIRSEDLELYRAVASTRLGQ